MSGDETSVLHVCTTDAKGGAGRAAFRIHRALVESHRESRMRVLLRGSDDPLVTGGTPPRSLTSRAMRAARRSWRKRRQRAWHTQNTTMHSFGDASAGIVEELNRADAQVLNLHWVSDMLSVRDIGALRKPIVWTLHDMWPFCGGEHYTDDGPSARFRLGYDSTQQEPGETGPDLNRRTWESKRRRWAGQGITVVCCSRWLAECARASVLFKDRPVHVIPNAIDTSGLWQPLGRETSRAALRLPQDKRLVLMGAEGGTTDPRKGGDLLREAIDLAIARSPGEFELMVYGQSAPTGLEHWPCPVHWLGQVRDDRVLVAAYSAADAVMVPSRQDNLPNAAVEAQACGTPVVAFDIGGLPDIVTHRETGWLARPFDVQDLADGILWILADQDRWAALSRAGRAHAVATFAPGEIADRYAAVYADAVR